MGKILNRYSKASNILDSFLQPAINFGKKLQNNINPLFSKLPILPNEIKNGLAGGLWIYAIINGFYSAFSLYKLFPLLLAGFPLLKVLGVAISLFLAYIYFSSIDGLRHARKSGYDLLYLATIGQSLVWLLNFNFSSGAFFNLLILAFIFYILSQTKNNFR